MAIIKSGASTDELSIDPTSKAARVTAYNPDGTIQYPGVKASYLAFSGSFTTAALATDIFSITGSATKIVKVFRVVLVSVQTSAGINSWNLVKRATANTGGTSTPLVSVRSDNNDPAPTASALIYSANPTTLGATLGSVWAGFIGAPAQPAPPGNPQGLAGLVGIEIDFVEELGKPVVLRSTSDVLSWNFGGAVVPVGLSLRVGVRWTEENIL